ncbi:T9SS type A sorting domain-containing protein [Mangrovimonas spongiae]|nr:T9SS type A sorting domain-containing protein [Mangrovimonas spongiae]
MSFFLIGNHAFSQIIVESGTISAGFGVDADVQTDGTWRIYENGNLLDPNSGSSDDWFQNDPLFSGGSGLGVIDQTYSPPSGNVEWEPRVGMSQDIFYVDPNGRRWLDGVFFRDTHWAQSEDDLNIFKTGSNKNADNPSTWNVIEGSNPAKNDIIDVMAHLRREGADFNTPLWTFIGASTRSDDGSSYLDFELYRTDLQYSVATGLTGVGPDGGHTSWQFDANGNITALGDVIISLNFENGGINIDGHIYLWVHPSDLPNGSILAANAALDSNPYIKFRFVEGGNGQAVFESGDGANGYGYAEIELKTEGTTVAFASINGENETVNPNISGDTPTGPWNTLFGPQANTENVYSQNSFVEFGLNLTEIGLDQSTVLGADCDNLFGRVVVKTRSSASFTSELKDIAGPFDFGDTPSIDVTIAGEDIPCGAEPDPVTLEANPLFACDLCEYQWYIGDPENGGTEIEGATNSTLEVTTPGVYGVQLAAPGLGGPGTGCLTYDVYEVGVEIPEPLYVNCPEPENINVCATQDVIDNALSTWFETFSVEGGELPYQTEIWTADGEEIDPETYVLPEFDSCTGGSVEISLTVIDRCDQEETCTSTFIVLPDDVAPTGTAPEGEANHNGCMADAESELPFDADAVALNYTDDCNDVTVNLTDTTVTGTDCAWTLTYTYEVVDNCGNALEGEELIHNGSDQDAPTGTAPEGEANHNGCMADAESELPFDADAVALNYTDDCNDVTVNLTDTTVTGTDCEWTLTYTYEVVDNCGNALEGEELIHNGSDQTDPEIVLPEIETTLCNDDFPETLSATWTDNCAAGGTLVVSGSNFIQGDCVQYQDYVLTATDNCGNSVTETITIERYYDKYDQCETAFGADPNGNSNCFINDGFSRWGWYNHYEEEGVYVVDLFAGAAHCDTANGTHVGTAEIAYLNGEVTVTYTMNSSGDNWYNFVMNEAHVYVGCGEYPQLNGEDTVAPGQYTVVADNLNHVTEYTVGPIAASGPINVIVHAVTCEVVCHCSPWTTGEFIPDAGSYEAIDCAPDESGDDSVRDLSLSNDINFTAYPVPFDEVVNISYKFDYNTDVTIEVYDIKGALVKSISNKNYMANTSGITKIDLSRADDQMYFVRLTTNKGVFTKKIVSSSPERR